MTYPWLQSIECLFAERLASGRLAHALLLAGPAGIGKQELARSFMASLLCLEKTYPACGACRSCQLFRSGAHPDGMILTFEPHPDKDEMRREILIGQVRLLIAALQLTTGLSARKAALIHPAEAMTRSAANALLKTLEEPPGESVLLLVAHNPGQLPATIRSRCQNLDAALPAVDQALDWLRAESGADEEDARLALEASAGSPLHARLMLRDGVTGQYRAVSGTLQDLRAGRQQPGQVLRDLGGMDQEQLWSWLSLQAASAVRGASGNPLVFKHMIELQTAADRNRRLARTPVRKDLLLLDWLIQWSRLEPQC